MITRHLAFFEFEARDLEDGFLYDLRKPDQALLVMDDDGYRLERTAEQVIQKRADQGMATDKLEGFLNQEQRRFVPHHIEEATVITGPEFEVGKAFEIISQNIISDKTRLRGYECGVFRWGGELLFFHFIETAAVAAVVADDLGLTCYRDSRPDRTGWRKNLSGRVLMNR
jgi:hypothetical protein